MEEQLAQQEPMELRAAVVRVVIDGEELLDILPRVGGLDRLERARALGLARRLQRVADGIAADSPT